MRILHTSDWHLGKRLNDRERAGEQVAVMDEIVRVADEEAVDAVIVAGDLFDTFNPPVEAIELLYRTLHRLARGGQRLVVAIAGNHDSPDRVDSPDVLARESGIFFAGNPMIVSRETRTEGGVMLVRSDEGFAEFRLPGFDYPLRVLLTPYTNGQRAKRYMGAEDADEGLRVFLRDHWAGVADKYCDTEGVNLLVAHLFMAREGGELPEEPEDERPINIGGADAVYTLLIPPAMQYAALGHLHRWQTVDMEPCPAVYSGSPLSYSFSEAEQDKYVTLVNLEPGGPACVTKRRLTSGRPLVRRRFEGVEAALQWLAEHPDTWVELTVATDTFLTAQEVKSLHAAHDGIVCIIPDVRDAFLVNDRVASIHDLRSDVNALFAEYFRQRKGQEPNEEIMSLFREALSIDGGSRRSDS
ncbi:exonuclease SbcCD subunit D [Butyricimonas sp.]|uniref:metallophosphoesterase family protein n=1 Tax=Butyricimonas sp. TaxID=1969738 RepID=UPI001B1D74E0|nr:exonuclease subunit SbcD [Butyricimonas sp.]MBO4958266.1 exonuclease subunit SbcD [Butyricimonas sp.]